MADPCGCYVAMALADGVSTPFVWRCDMHEKAPSMNAALRAEIAQLRAENERLGKAVETLIRDDTVFEFLDTEEAAVARHAGKEKP